MSLTTIPIQKETKASDGKFIALVKNISIREKNSKPSGPILFKRKQIWKSAQKKSYNNIF